MGDAKREVVEDCLGYMYVSGNGQLVVDRHASDEEHLLATATRESQPLYDCRVYLRDVVPAEWQGKWGRLVAVRTTVKNGDAEVECVQLTFTPTDKSP